MSAITVAIVDDQPLARTGLEQVAASVRGLTIAASVATVEELDNREADHDVVILHIPNHDHGLPIETISRIAQSSRPVLIATWDRPPSLLAAIQAGARGCLTRQSSHEAVARALTVAAEGGFYLCEQLMQRFHLELNGPSQSDTYGLAPRELETLQWIARGLTHAQIATRMGLTLATIDTYAKRIRGKLNVSNKAELTRIAIELGSASHPRMHSAA
jgi:DNA-binding NarL/FixJ family response regulator